MIEIKKTAKGSCKNYKTKRRGGGGERGPELISCVTKGVDLSVT